MEFEPYVVEDRKFEDLTFPFLIADKTGREWYDGSSNQVMPERLWCKSQIRQGFSVIDAGAHHGMMSVLFGKWVGPLGRVISYEIVPSNAAVIEKNLKLNALTNVVVKPYGLSDECKEVEINFNESNAMAGHGNESKARVVRLDDDIPDSFAVDFIKIDVEGSDLEAVQGACRVLQQRPYIDLELHNFLFKDRLATLRSIFNIIHNVGWKYHVMPDLFDEFIEVNGSIDLQWLSTLENPHVYCTPR